ncbi:hypothetical protein SVI_2822 [Shewanella violacea DSS12]|uniref:Uncharacterized protein n=1 Tax=Shewanella violacea (strain JCM 10179 / CIP 106290 / LMG 19151 / DSS12) TaxID=637905 RepID=D4ZM94_SHEVD|nr:hypothetical protein SVI_2822 [Shewanella violacea DSS12]
MSVYCRISPIKQQLILTLRVRSYFYFTKGSNLSNKMANKK